MLLSMRFFFPQDLDVPENARTWVAVIISKYRSFSGELAVRKQWLRGCDWTLSQKWDGAVAARIAEKFLDTHVGYC
jgi:hypothetical protein